MKKLIILSTLGLLLTSCGKDDAEPVNAAPLTFAQLAFQTNGVARIGQSVSYTRLMRRPRTLSAGGGERCEFAGEDVVRTVVETYSNRDIRIEERRTLSVILNGDSTECTRIAEEVSSVRDDIFVSMFEVSQTFDRLKQDFERACQKECGVVLENQRIDGRISAVLTTKGYVRNQGNRRGGFGQEAYETTVLVLNTDSPWLSPYRKKVVGTQLYYSGGNRLTQREHVVTINN